jgi:hypothetical protein
VVELLQRLRVGLEDIEGLVRDEGGSLDAEFDYLTALEDIILPQHFGPPESHDQRRARVWREWQKKRAEAERARQATLPEILLPGDDE